MIFGVDYSSSVRDPSKPKSASRSVPVSAASGVGSSDVFPVVTVNSPSPAPASTSSPAPAPGRSAQPVQSALPAPYDNLDLYISGSAEYTDRGREVKQVYFEAYKGQQFFVDLKLTDLVLAGYDVQVISDCFVRLSYQGRVIPVICRKSSVSDDSVVARAAGVASERLLK